MALPLSSEAGGSTVSKMWGWGLQSLSAFNLLVPGLIKNIIGHPHTDEIHQSIHTNLEIQINFVSETLKVDI